MAYIYKITNQINQRCYIGKTLRTIEVRWREHRKDYQKPDTRFPFLDNISLGAVHT
jgi:hypothetical protein